MLRRVLIALLLSPLLACAQSQAPDTAATPVATPAAEPAAATAPVEPAAAPSTADVAAAPTLASADVATPVAAPAPAPVAPSGPPPRPGIDFEVLASPQPTWGQGRIEVAEIFGYPCIHCANLQPVVNEWHKTLPADVRFEYVPAIFGGVWDNFARGYFAAQLMGVDTKTHDAVFKAFHIDHAIGAGSVEDVAEVYSRLGVDRDRFLSTMKSFGVDAKMARARQFAARAGVDGTPTFIVAGKYRVKSSRDRGFPGMVSTVDHLVAQERAAQAAGAP